MKHFLRGGFSHIFITLTILSFSGIVSVRGNKCTSVLSRNEIHEVVLKVPCIQKYEARCGWLSLNYCTFYHQTHCDKPQNETVKMYYIHTDCCDGYYMASNGSCFKKQPGVVYKTTPASAKISADPAYVAQPVLQKAVVKDEKLVISGGAYAGIACGLVLLASIVGFIIVAVLKKNRRKKQKPDTRQEVQYVSSPKGSVAMVMNSESTGSTPIVKNYGRTGSPSVQLSISPTSSRMVTAPTSPVKMSYTPADTPLLASSKKEVSTSPVRYISSPVRDPETAVTEPLMPPDAVNLDIPESDI